jgi:hypothetical protein
MTDKPRDYAEELDNATVRIDHLIWLPGLVTTDTHLDVPSFEEFIEEVFDYESVEIENLPELKTTLELAAEENLNRSDFAEELASRFAFNRRNGFLAKIATPVTSNHKDRGYTFSWGHYRTNWIYAETIDDLTNQAVAWAEAEHEKDRVAETEKQNATAQEQQQ